MQSLLCFVAGRLLVLSLLQVWIGSAKQVDHGSLHNGDISEVGGAWCSQQQPAITHAIVSLLPESEIDALRLFPRQSFCSDQPHGAPFVSSKHFAEQEHSKATAFRETPPFQDSSQQRFCCKHAGPRAVWWSIEAIILGLTRWFCGVSSFFICSQLLHMSSFVAHVPSFSYPGRLLRNWDVALGACHRKFSNDRILKYPLAQISFCPNCRLELNWRKQDGLRRHRLLCCVSLPSSQLLWLQGPIGSSPFCSLPCDCSHTVC